VTGKDSERGISQEDELGRLRAEHAKVVQALQEAIRDTTRLTRLFAILNEAAPLDKLLDRVLSTLSELFIADVVILFEARREGEFVALASIGLPIGSQPRKVLAEDCRYIAAALEEGKPVCVAEVQADAEVSVCLREQGVETAVWLPAVGDEETSRGVLVLGRCRPIPFVPSDVDLLTTMAYRVALMVERDHAEQERRRLDTRLRLAEKTESLGRMAAAIAHNFNNMLAVVLSSLEVALDDLSAQHGVYEDLLCAREATKRAARTSELMLAYLGQSAGERETIDLGQLLREALPGLLSSLPSDVRCTSDLREAKLLVSVSPPQIVQLLGNLLANAWEAMDGGPGNIDISLHKVPGAQVPKTQTLLADWKPKAVSYACLTVSDNGCGMSPETVEKIFDPFFTTKVVGRGLGLPVVLGAVRAYEGLVTVESKRALGTTFRVFLPLLPRATQLASVPMALSSVPDTTKSLVLVAEDEEHLRRAIQRMFKRLGYEVLAAADGMAALQCFRERADDLRFAMIDIAMPRMDGWTTLEAIRELRPDFPVILTSGYDEQHILEAHTKKPLMVFLHKPYTLGDLRNAIESLLGQADRKTARS
jgi:signal transduction histidine kinase/CheY-like chemotaxis protein